VQDKADLSFLVLVCWPVLPHLHSSSPPPMIRGAVVAAAASGLWPRRQEVSAIEYRSDWLLLMRHHHCHRRLTPGWEGEIAIWRKSEERLLYRNQSEYFCGLIQLHERLPYGT
jgi:hypothetical protein